MVPKIVALFGSPKVDGNTALLMEKAITGAIDAGCEVEVIVAPALELSACKELFFCLDSGSCILEDDFTTLVPLLSQMESLIIATPVMTMGVPGALKSFMDRCQVFFMSKYARKKPLVKKELISRRKTLLISICGMNLKNNFDGVKASTKAVCDSIDCSYSDELLVPDMDNKKDLNLYPEILEEAYNKGFNLGAGLTGMKI